MTLRWPTRQVYASVALHLRTGLDALGWFDNPPSLGNTLIAIWDDDHVPEAAVAGAEAPKPNTIGLSLGDLPDHRPQEIGGGLYAVEMPLFVDIYGETRSMSLTIADDVTGILQGALWASSRYVPLYDHSKTPAELLTDRACEVHDVEGRWPANADAGAEWRRKWRVIAFSATVYFPGPGNE